MTYILKPNELARLDVYKYGVNEIGRPTRSPEGSWFRFDTWTRANGETMKERRFAAACDDYSPIYEHWEGSNYDSRCSCCYLGFSHTATHHAQKLAEYEPGTCPRCHVGSKRECRCTFDTGRNYPFSDGMIFAPRTTSTPTLSTLTSAPPAANPESRRADDEHRLPEPTQKPGLH